jgi:hypothetical protein
MTRRLREAATRLTVGHVELFLVFIESEQAREQGASHLPLTHSSQTFLPL